MSKTMKRVSALLLAILMIVTYMPMMQETAYAAKKAKKPAKVKGLKATVKKNTKKIALSWKKAKNAKKYLVTIKDNSTKLSATKTSKKTKLTITGQWNTKYTIKVQGVNGKKKGSAAKKTVKIGADPSKVSKSKYDADMKKAAEKNKAAVESLKKDLEKAIKDLSTAQANSATQKEAVEKAQAIIDAYDKAVEAGLAVPEDLAAAIKDAREAVKEAELQSATELKHKDWNPEVKKALNDMIAANKGKANKYAVFDFDNTCSIYDVEEQLAVYQLQTMAFASDMTAEKLADVLDTEIGLDKDDFPLGLDTKLSAAKMEVSYFTGESSYQDWIDDITAAYQRLLDGGYKPRPEGYPLGTYDETNADWLEFATKMRAMYDLVYDSESAAIAYPWVLYWFTGMTEQEVYNLAKASHSYYKEQDTKYVHWVSPEKVGQKAEGVNYWWSYGTQVSDNIKELMAALDNNGIDVWVCSASATDPIRAAVDVWGLHDHVTGVMAMTNKLEDGKYVSEYDWKGGNAWLTKPNGGWEKDTALQKTQTQGRGKVIAIKNIVLPKYDGYGPIAGFMDSTGDYNFCTEFKDLEVVTCFNRASRKVTDGGGVIGELAVYQAEELGYDYATARANGDTLYVLQGRDETGTRSLRPYRETIRVTDSTADPAVGDSPKLFAKPDNQTQYDKMVELGMTTETIVNDFAIKTAKNDPKYGFTFKYGFVYGVPGEGLGPRFDGIDFAGYHTEGKGTNKKLLKLDSWNPEVKKALNDMMLNADNAEGQYAVFDFDNTCSIYDVEEQLAVYQLQTMAFASDMTAEKLADVLDTEIGLDEEKFPQGLETKLDATKMDVSYFTGQSSYKDWIDDITAAYQRLLNAGYKPRPEGYPLGTYDETNADWLEFATKMRAMYDLVYDSESAAIAYPWVLYWFTGMTEEEVYNLAKASHSFYKEQDTKYVHWVSPDNSAQKAEGVNYWWSYGTQVSENINELMEALDANGIDVWVCSASATDPIRAAVDVFGLHDYVTGVMAMTNKLENGKYVSEYDWKGGNAWLTDGDGWKKDTALQKTQTQGKGKVIAIQNVVYPKYNNHGPIAGFMDSTGDYNFCTEFETLQTVCCFNRASRKVTDGGGVIAELAVYQAEELGYDYAKAQKAGDTLYVLQGRDETGKRSLRPYRETIRVTDSTADPAAGDAPKLFAKPDNQTQYNKMVELGMDTETIVNDFALKKDKNDPKYGFSFKYGFVYGVPGEGLGPRFQDDKYNPNGVDFGGYHSQK